jgi:hypothetical protein
MTEIKSLSLRDKLKLRSQVGSFKLFPWLPSPEPASPARYPGKRISIGSPSAREGREEWYVPPSGGGSSRRSRQIQTSMSDGTERAQRETARPLSLSVDAGVRSYDLQSGLRVWHAEMQSERVLEVLQTVASTWLPHPRIKESFIALLRTDGKTVRERAATPTELRLIEVFLDNLPSVHILPRGAPARERNLNLSGEVPPTGRAWDNIVNRVTGPHQSPHKSNL